MSSFRFKQSPPSQSSAMSNASQLNDLRSYSRHWLSEFIDLYQNEECLWLPKHQDYSNHSARNKSYDKLVEKLKEVEPHPDRAMVVRKINSLRSAFRREFRKTSMKSNYETRLWYYEKLLFIAEQKPKRTTSSPHDAKPPKRELQLHFDDDDSIDFEEEQVVETIAQTESSSNSQNDPIGTITVSSGECVTLVKNENHHHHQQQQQQHHSHQQQQICQQHSGSGQQHGHTAVKVLEITSLDTNSQREIQQAVNSLEHQHQMQQQLQQQANGQTTAAQLTQIHHQQVPTIQIAREHLQPLFSNSTYAPTTHRQEDEYDAIGINVASKLRVINTTQRIIAEKLISDVLFNAQLDSLTVNSALTQ